LRPDAILFDFDGVIVNTLIPNRRHWEEFAERIGEDPKTIFTRAWGRRTRDVMDEIAAKRPFDLEVEFAHFEKVSREDFAGMVKVPGARQLLQALPPDRWGIVTGGDPDTTRAMLAQLALPIPKVLIGNRDVSHGKPNPEGYLTGAERLGVHPRAALVIEDASAGIEAGHGAGAKVLALLTTTRQADLPLEHVAALARDLSYVESSFVSGGPLNIDVQCIEIGNGLSAF